MFFKNLSKVTLAAVTVLGLAACEVDNGGASFTGTQPTEASLPGAAPGLNVAVLTTTNRIARSQPTTPGCFNNPCGVALTGLAMGENMLAIDYRPSTGTTTAAKTLYGISSLNKLYTINLTSGAATFVGDITPAPTGVVKDMDFNPVPDLIRVLTDTDENLAVDPVTAVATVGTALTPASVTAQGAAYTNNFHGARQTTLYVADLTTLYLQGDPNGAPGTPGGGVLTTVGSLGVTLTGDVGFDIDGFLGLAYLAGRVGTSSNLYTVNLVSGAATQVATFNATAFGTVRDLAIEPPLNPEMFAIDSANNLVRFPIAGPGPFAVTTVAPVTFATGHPSTTLIGLDFRPAVAAGATSALQAMGANGCIYNLTISGATPAQASTFDRDAATAGIQCNPSAPVSPAFNATSLTNGTFGFDFNPTVDRIRVINDAQDNQRFVPTTGLVVDFDAVAPGIQPDTNLSAAGVTAAAYTNSFVRTNMLPAPTVTTNFVINSTTDMLALQGGLNGTPSPNAGAITNVGALGVDVTGNNGFDIIGGNTRITTPVTAWVNASAFAVLALTATPAESSLYSVDLVAGTATLIGALTPVTDIRAAALRIER